MDIKKLIKNQKEIAGVLPGILALGFVFSIQSCENANAADPEDSAVFKYREIFLPEGIGENAEALGLNTLEVDWGIWGHNLAKVLPDDHSKSVYAKVNGNTLKKQFCFSSNHLYEYIEDYIDRNYDEEETIRFAIIPNDNDIVCLCEKCVTIGNKKGNATPAVTSLVRKLSQRFPGHIFYTSDYKTTKTLPKDSMPSNTGVLISAINFPLSAVQTPEETRFMNRIKDWKTTTPRVIVWDYINNFDDYFTPFPTLGAMQRRLQGYRDNEVDAVFLNGSGPDISTMSHLHTEVLAELTKNPDTDWRVLLREKAKEHYPVTGEVIADFMIAQEESVEQRGSVLPLYDGVEKALQSYLQEDEFMTFHDNLIKLREKVSGKEKQEIDKLLGELALTRLELNRIKGNPAAGEKFLKDLEALSINGYPSYNESGWTIEGYINDYRYLLDHYKDVGNRNKLKGETLIAMTPLDPDYSDISILTDGVLGTPSNYHNGNMIISPDIYSQIAIPNKSNLKKIRVWMTYNPAYKVKLPESVTLKANGRSLGVQNPQYPVNLSGHSYVDFDIPSGTEGTFTLTFFKEGDTKSMAIEEIEGF